MAVIALVLRKPWSLHTPQLHAEDGSIFLIQDDQLGAAAIWTPYNGYLLLLPRLVAWVARHTADPSWWPFIYNVAAFLITAGLFIRFASPRLDVPGKPWLLLTFALVAHTGEVFFTITNLQWLTAFFLLLQVLMARPFTTSQRIGDLTILFLAGLTGPIAIIWLPLFAWRWWRDRNRDTLTTLLVIAVCAGAQGWFLSRPHPSMVDQSQPVQLLMLCAVVGSRLAVWPVFGAGIARGLPLPALAAIGCGLIVAFAGWTLRPHPRRRLRVQVLAAFVLITVACLHRLRPDTWETANLENGDRYFYVSRVLLAWLLVWEFDSTSRVVAWCARGLYVLAALAQLPHYILPAPPNYHWAEHCDPIRRGSPASIPTLPEGWRLEYPGREKKRE